MVSHVRGRIRVRDKVFRGPHECALTASARAVAGVMDVVRNPVSGSLLISYEPDATDLAALLDVLGRVGDAAKRPKARRGPSRTVRKLVKVGLAATFGVGIGAAIAGATKVHVAFSLAFTGLLAVHMLQNKKTLLDL